MRNLRNYSRVVRFRVHRSLLLLAIVLESAVFISNPALGQTTADGTIHGQVTDAGGSALPNVNIVAHSTTVGGTFKALSDPEGNYRLTELPPGTDYTVEAEISGFEKFQRSGLIVRAGLNVTVDVQLKIGSADQTVQVSGEVPLIDTQSAEQAINLSGELLRDRKSVV